MLQAILVMALAVNGGLYLGTIAYTLSRDLTSDDDPKPFPKVRKIRWEG